MSAQVMAEVRDIGEARGRRERRLQAAVEPLLSKRQIADMLGVSTSTVDNWCREKGMPFHQGPGGRRRFRASEVLEWYG